MHWASSRQIEVFCARGILRYVIPLATEAPRSRLVVIAPETFVMQHLETDGQLILDFTTNKLLARPFRGATEKCLTLELR